MTSLPVSAVPQDDTAITTVLLSMDRVSPVIRDVCSPQDMCYMFCYVIYAKDINLFLITSENFVFHGLRIL